MKRIKSKVIEATVLFNEEGKCLRRIVFISNSIDSLILDLQELFPKAGINRDSVMSWKFMTVSDFEKFKQKSNYNQSISAAIPPPETKI